MTEDSIYLAHVLQAVRVCLDFRPKFGRSNALTLAEFEEVYSEDAFYTWFGLDTPAIYAAHRAGAGITSMYRQIGIGCQWALSHIIRDQLSLNTEDSEWTFSLATATGKSKRLSLDARIPLARLTPSERSTVSTWLQNATQALDKPSDAARNGAVFEMRQGYKSADSKRQNADVDNAAHAYAYGYLPVVLLLSAQINTTVAKRYEKAGWLLLRGTVQGTPLTSTYVFFRDVVGYDVAAFFARNSKTIREEVKLVAEKLLGES